MDRPCPQTAQIEAQLTEVVNPLATGNSSGANLWVALGVAATVGLVLFQLAVTTQRERKLKNA